MNRRTQRKHRTNSRGATVNRRDRMAAIEVLEPRGMLSGIPLTFLPPTLRDASVVAPPAAVAALRTTDAPRLTAVVAIARASGGGGGGMERCPSLADWIG